jgi:hypothetical protein
MKLITLMALNHHKDEIRKIFAKYDVQIYSEVAMTGHTSETIKQNGWWVFEQSDIPLYSTLFFSIINENKADEVLRHIEKLREKKQEHPIRAFQMDIEKMI